MSVIQTRGEAGGGVASHLQCTLCGHLSRSHAHQLSHIAASHPTSLDDVAFGRLGNIVIYQSSAKLYHCFECFFTSKDFSKIYKHIISKHCMDGEGGGDGVSEKGEEKTVEGEGEGGGREDVSEKTREKEGGGGGVDDMGEKGEEKKGGYHMSEKGEEDIGGEEGEERGQVAIKEEEEGEGLEEEGASQRAKSAQTDSQKDGNGPFEAANYRCLICGLISKQKCIGVHHVMRKHDIPKTYAAQAIKRCTVTSKHTRSRGTTEEDEEEEEEETGLSRELLTEEVEAMAKVIRFISNRFVCLICGWKTKLKGFAVSHVVSCHDVERPYTCKDCQSSFFLPSRLQQHISTAHRPGRYGCPFCSFRSHFLGGFRRHCSRCTAREGREDCEQGKTSVEEEEKRVVRKRRRTVRAIKEEEEQDDHDE